MYNLRILYVEDDQNVRESLENYLKDVCKYVYCAKDGKEALDIFTQNIIDVVITDISMPNIDGLELSKKLLSLNENLPIIITSAFTNVEYLHKAIEIGINNYLFKPIDLDKFTLTLEKIWKHKQKDEEILRYQKELEEINNSLEKKIKNEIIKNREKDALLVTQAKHAQMGEMIGMIAHQWRQPLNAISAASIQITMKYDFGILTKEDFHKTQTFIQNKCQDMSAVIDTFMNHLKENQKIEEFSLDKVLKQINDLIGMEIKAHDISLVFDNLEKFKLFGNANMLEQILLNLIINAKDAFLEHKKIKNKEIKITTTKQKTIEIIDNAGGISNQTIEKIFNPYFTTKEPGKGTGLGLYMSKKIMQEHFKGDIIYEKINNGSKFILTFS